VIQQVKPEEHAVPASLEIPAQNAEESRPLSENRLFTIESEGDRSFHQQPAKVGGAVDSVITEEHEAEHETSHRSLLEQEKEHVAAHSETNQEAPVLSSSLHQNWEEMRAEKAVNKSGEHDLTKSHVVFESDEKSITSVRKIDNILRLIFNKIG
jgi:hypothetical protein